MDRPLTLEKTQELLRLALAHLESLEGIVRCEHGTPASVWCEHCEPAAEES